MNHPERSSQRRTSIPPRTSLDVLRGAITIQIGGGSLVGGVKRVSREPIAGEQDWSKGETDWRQVVTKQVFKKPPIEKKARPGSLLYKRDGKIEWDAEIMEDYNGKEDLGIILYLTGIGITDVPFLRSKHNKPDSPVFYMPVNYNKRMARLFLATRGDILESQICPAQMDVNPFFQEELYLPQLATTHDPASMAVIQNNGLVTVGYNPRTTR